FFSLFYWLKTKKNVKCEMCSNQEKNDHLRNSGLKFKPDIVIVPECEKIGEQTTKSLWFGEKKKKGLGIFSYSNFDLELNKNYNPSFRYIIPIKVTGDVSFNLLAIWAMNEPNNVKQRYIGQIYSAIDHYKELLDEPIIIIGDFNWNVIWDTKLDYPLNGTLTDIINILKNKNIVSTYHTYYKEEFGMETKPTLFMYHKKEKSYHIDYCFASRNFKINNVEVGIFSDWIKSSDHVPIIVTFEETFS
ncbi:MAG: endonuclease/exonuclease/phosphatase family protein, partial [Euryarchaeota archaeon]|nr:endonuclease/exonuclease/phosphatase family protein [Euryarchaeota archaeon]